jgi:hypothetical protein
VRESTNLCAAGRLCSGKARCAMVHCQAHKLHLHGRPGGRRYKQAGTRVLGKVRCTQVPTPRFDFMHMKCNAHLNRIQYSWIHVSITPSKPRPGTERLEALRMSTTELASVSVLKSVPEGEAMSYRQPLRSQNLSLSIRQHQPTQRKDVLRMKLE